MERNFPLSLVLLFSLVAACAQPLDDSLAAVDVATWPIVDGSPDAVGLLDLLNDPTTTEYVLDYDARLDRRAARNLILARGAYGEFGSVADVDAVRWVGASAIDKLVAFAHSQGRVPGENDLLGTWDNVSFTVAQAELMLEIVINDLDHHDFDIYIGLDRRAADSIVDAQPVQSVAVLAGLYYVGTSALQKLKGEAEEMMDDEWPACIPTFTQVANEAADEFSQLLAISTTIDNPWARARAFQSSGCGDWWNDAGALAAAEAAIWDLNFFIPWSDLNDDYRQVSALTSGGANYTGTLELALDVIEERIDDGDFDPNADANSERLYGSRLGLVDELSVDVGSNPGAYLQQQYDFDLSECSEEAVMLLDVRDGSILFVHELQNC